MKADYDICLEHLEEIRDFMIRIISEKTKENEECDLMLSDIMNQIDTEIDSKISSVKKSNANKGGSKKRRNKTKRRRKKGKTQNKKH